MEHNQQFEENLNDILDFDSGVTAPPVHQKPESQSSDQMIQCASNTTHNKQVQKIPLELIIRIAAGIIAIFLLITFGITIAYH